MFFVYGQRFTGTITAAANTRTYTNLFKGVDAILSAGGTFIVIVGGDTRKYSVGGIDTASAVGASSSMITVNNHIAIVSQTVSSRNACGYDVWAIYTKPE